MHVCVIFYNLGGYHLARLAAADHSCRLRGWKLSAIEITRTTSEHPWGKLEVPDYVTTLDSHHAGDFPSLTNSKKLEDALNQLAPDAIAIPGWGHNFARHALDWCIQNRRVRILLSESKYDDSPRSWWKELWKQWKYVRRFHGALVGGKKHAAYLQRLGMHGNRIFHGYDVVDTTYLTDQVDRIRSGSKESSRPNLVPDNPFFLAVNRFIPRKNIETLIQAFAETATVSTERWDLVLLGSGEQEGRLKAQAAELGLRDRIHFPGFASYEDIPIWYAYASGFVHPALSEQWGLVVNEAMAAGLPILLSSACGCHPDLLEEGKNGFSFCPTDAGELAGQMVTMMSSADRRKNMGMASRDLITRQFPPTAFGEGLCQSIEATGPRS